MAHAKKTWRQKLADAKAKPGLPKLFFCEDAGKRMVVPSPGEVEQIIRAVPRGRVATIAQIARRLEKDHGVDLTCPMTTGIFAWIIAHAEEEAAEAGAGKRRRAEPQTPWWRILKASGEVNPKYPGAGRTQSRRLRAEGHRVIAKGRKLVVADYEKSLHDLD